MKLNAKMMLLCLDVYTRLSATFTMIKKTYKVRSILKAVDEGVRGLQEVNPTEADWDIRKKICDA